MVDTIKFSEMTDGGDINNNKKVPGLKDGGNVLFNNPWTFLPPGTTADRPLPSADMYFRLRFNTDLQEYEFYDSVLAAWTQLQDSAFTAGPFITYTADASLPDAQNLGALANGILKQTIAAGVATLAIAVQGTDYYGPGDNATFSGITMTGDIDMGGFKAINAADPTNPQDYATKFYVDQTALSGTSVYAATTTNLLVTQSGSGVGATLTDASGTFAPLTLDGEAVPLGEDFLVKDLISPEHEGIYTLTTNGDGISIPWQGTRSVNYDTPSQINTTGLIVVRNGTTLAGTTWYNADTIVTVDTTPFDYAQFGSSYVLSVIGTANQIDVDNTDAQNPILSLSATLDLPGTLAIQGSVAIDDIIDDDTMATATDSNISTSEAIKAYIDSLPNGEINSVNVQILTVTGTYTPTTGMAFCYIKGIGGGGGGAGAPNTGASQVATGGGGGAGGTFEGFMTAAQVGATASITIGAAGTGGAAGQNNGVTGGNTVFTASGTGGVLTGNGGVGGTSQPVQAPGAGGIALSVVGGLGGTATSTVIGIKATSGYPGGQGFGAVTGGVSIGGYGANSVWGAGGRPAINASGSAAGGGNGAGGAGGASNNASGAAAGGDGTIGVIMVMEFISG